MSKELYKQEIEKQAAIGAAIGAVAKKALPMIAKGAKSFASMGIGKRMLTGAGVNAAISGLTYKPADGKGSVKGRLGAMAGGAVSGAMAGGMASKSNISNLGSKIGDVGEKVFNGATKMNAGGATDIVGNIGIGMNTAGKKISDYFK